MDRDTLGLGRQLGTRLRPLAIATALAIALGLPSSYYALEFNALSRDAARHADDLGQRLRQASVMDQRSFGVLLGDFLPGRSITNIAVSDAHGRALATYDHDGSGVWLDRRRPSGRATIGTGTERRDVTVSVSQTGLLTITLVLLGLSTAVGVAVGGVMYLYPVRIARGAETQIGELLARQETLLEASRLLASTLDLRQVLDRLTEIARSLPGIDVVRIWLKDERGGRIVLHSQAGVRRADVGHRVVLEPGSGLTAAVVETGRPVVLRDSFSDPRLVNVEWARAEGLVSFLGVPLRVGDDCVGALACMSRRPHDWSRTDIALAETLGMLAALAIRNASLFGESEGRRRVAEALADAGRVLAQALDPEAVGRQVTEAVGSLLGVATTALFRVAPDTGDLVAIATSGGATALGPGLVLPRGTGLAGLAIAARVPMVTSDVLHDERVALAPDLRAAIERAGCAAELVVPLLVKDRVIGALCAGDAAGRVFMPDEIGLARALGDQAALALENARLYAQATRRQSEAEQLARVARSLTESLELAQVCTRIVDSVMALFGAHSSGLFWLERDQSLRALAWAGAARHHFAADDVLPPGTGVEGRAVMWGAPVQSRDALADPDVIMTQPMRERLHASGDRAMLAVPLHAKGELTGVLSISGAAARDFTEAEIALLQRFADQAALALENARLYQSAQQAYRELSEAQAQLVRGETLRAMGELASGVAHHLNNLLAVVIGRLQLARTRHAVPQIDRHLELAERAALDGAEVVRRMRGFSLGQPSPDMAPVNLNAIAREVVELTRPRWQDEAQVRGVTIDMRLEAGAIPPIQAEAAALREVLMNLILNAIDALPQGGAVTIRTSLADDAVHCEVTDTGVGMTPDVQKHALEPFFTTKGFQSTGLGLSVNYGIVRRHGGELTIESAPGEGTSVRFWLPTGAPAPRPAAPAPAPMPVATALRILVIDDEPRVREVVSEVLEGQGHTVVAAAGGPEGLRQLEADGGFDLVLTDLGMPGMTGWEVALAAKAKSPGIRVGLMTGWGAHPAAKPDERAAADFVLAKPVTLEGLRAALAYVRPASSRAPATAPAPGFP
jgi:GAF domain-containing protein/ActR/RegA family two-component response regulator